MFQIISSKLRDEILGRLTSKFPCNSEKYFPNCHQIIIRQVTTDILITPIRTKGPNSWVNTPTKSNPSGIRTNLIGMSLLFCRCLAIGDMLIDQKWLLKLKLRKADHPGYVSLGSQSRFQLQTRQLSLLVNKVRTVSVHLRKILISSLKNLTSPCSVDFY